MTANHRLSGGLAFGTAYTLAKTMSMIRTRSPSISIRASGCIAYDASDRRHILSFQGSWNLPKGSALWNSARRPGHPRRLAARRRRLLAQRHPGDRHLYDDRRGGTDTMGGGDPVRISMVDGCSPILSRGERSEERWFDTSCFFRTPVGSYGDTPLNNVRQPGNMNVDLSMSKTFPIGSHGHRLQFRADAYNAFRVTTRTVNAAAQYDPLGNQVNSDFGRLALPTDEARQIELSLRYSF